ncbi:MAG: hypothetical protein SFY69_07680 [Planctomycetota bacterium]|nr:hypothetical protein [Planctomycetota bacterium]
MRTTLLLVAASLPVALGALARAEPLLSNGSANPASPALGAASATQSGVPAPTASFWSEAPIAGLHADAVGGFASHAIGADGAFRFADDFSVPAGGWTLQGVTVYAYQPGAAGPMSPFVGLTLRIWSGRPGDAGAAVVFGDDVTNRMGSSQPTSIYRVFSTTAQPLPQAPDTTRLVWATTASLPSVYLSEGQYWLDWQYVCLDPNTPAYSPAVTVPGVRSVGNAVQLRQEAGRAHAGWYAVVDAGKPAEAADLGKDLPFLLDGVPGVACEPDFNQDGNVDQDDVGCLAQVVAGDPSCSAQDPDFNRDGNVDQDDLSALAQVIAGAPCP